MSKNTKIVHNYVSDMLALEKHIKEALERQVNDETMQNHNNASYLIRNTGSMLSRHIAALENHLETYGDDNSPVKEAIAATLGAAAGLFDKIRSNTASKMLRDDYTALSMTAISYTMLHTTALALGNQPVATMALNHLKDITPVITEISKEISEVVVWELDNEGIIVNPNAGVEGTNNTQEAWAPHHVNQMVMA